MALTSFKKVGIYGWKPLREEILAELQRLGAVEIIEEAESPENGGGGRDGAQENLSRVQFCLSSLSGFTKKALLENFLPSKIDVPRAEYQSALDNFPLEDFHSACRRRDERSREIASLRDKLKEKLEQYRPWAELQLSMSDLGRTKSAAFALIRVNLRLLETMKKHVEEYGFVTPVAQNKSSAFCAAGFLISRESDFAEAVSGVDGEIITLDPLEGQEDMTPAQAIRGILKKIGSLEAEERGLIASKKEDARHITELMVLYDHYMNIKNRREASERMLYTGSAFSLKGWMPEKHIPALIKRLEDKFPEVFLEVLTPGKGEVPPVQLANSASVAPFETVTGLYGLPGEEEMDPTPFFAPFFALFFAVCMTDAGYGLMILLLSFLLVKKMRVGRQAMKFIRLLIITGAATVVVGVLTGSLFGIQPAQVPEAFGFMLDLRARLMLFDPMEQFLVFMIVSLGMGFLQVWLGYAVKMVQEIKAGRAVQGIASQLPWLVILPGFLLMGITKSPETVLLGLVQESPLGSGWESASLAMVYAGIAGMFIQPGSEGGLVKKIGSGVYSLYGLIGCLGDVLSYVRLFALGLATVAMAIAINTMASMALEIPVAGFFVALVIAVGGHTANMAINAFSAFIHTVRLQFVEFFTKFYGGGGRDFSPFSYTTSYIEEKNVVESAGEKRGGNIR